MKILKKKMLTVYLQRVRAPHGMTLKAYNAFYAKLIKKYGSASHYKIVSRSSYYSDGGYWLVERRMETDKELAKRQAVLDKRIALQKADALKRKAKRKAEAAKWVAVKKAKKAAEEKARIWRKVEELKTMVEVLQLAGYKISPGKVSSARS